MHFLKYNGENGWWEWDQEKMIAYNYHGGHHYIDENALGDAEYCECESWRELYLKKHYCPIEVDVFARDVWISPDGKYYDGEAHAVMAEHICELVYGFWKEIDYAEHFLEEHGWVKATTSLMWELRFEEWYWKELPQRQYDALWDWCQCHRMPFPQFREE